MQVEPIAALSFAVMVTFVVFSIGLLRRIAIYRRGRPRQIPILPALFRVPRRYLVDVHEKVDRDRLGSWMHILVAGGFLAALLCCCLTLAWPGEYFLRLAGLVSAAAMLGGASLSILRRSGRIEGYPASPSQGQWRILGPALGFTSLGFAGWFLSSGQSWTAGSVLAAGLFYTLAAASWRAPLRHALAGVLNLAFHERPGRFAESPDRGTALTPLALNEPRLGVKEATDWNWTRRLNFDACVECGRCEAACPAFAAAQPLNPKALVNDLARACELPLGDYDGQGHPGAPTVTTPTRHAIIPGFVQAQTIWSCTTCRACVEECPMFIEHVDAIMDLRRFEVLERAAIPAHGAAALNNYSVADTPGGDDPARRFDWAAGLDLPLVSDIRETELLLWAGNAAFDSRGQRTLRALVGLLHRAGIEPAILGEEERDCGDLARRLGDEATFQRLARLNIATLQSYRIGMIITPDPHVLHVMTEEYTAYGDVPRVLHHSQLLDRLVADGRLGDLTGMAGRITYHDPCYLGRYCGEFDAPRRILSSIAGELVEMERARGRSRCCGGGGGAPVTDIPGKRRIPDIRMADADATSASVVAVACPNCAVMLEGVSDRNAEIADIAELLARAAGIET